MRFISNCESDQIIATDNELHKMKSFGTHDLKFNQLNNPSGIFFICCNIYNIVSYLYLALVSLATSRVLTSES